MLQKTKGIVQTNWTFYTVFKYTYYIKVISII